MQTVGAHGLDVRRPLVDEHDVKPGIGEVGRDAASVRAGPENCDFLVHLLDVFTSRRKTKTRSTPLSGTAMNRPLGSTLKVSWSPYI
jgi:hypothetical protein